MVPSLPSFAGQTVIVTGASTGIGRETAIAFCKAGARVTLAARSEDALLALASELGDDVTLPFALDVADQDQCQAMVAATVARWGGVDVLVNNAGMVVSGTFEYLQPGDMERQFAVNFFGVVYCTQAALPYLKQSHGVIVNISSIAGLVGTPTTSAYSASKAALNSLGQSLAVELKPYGVAVTTVCPYFTSGVQLAQKGTMRGGSLHTPDQRPRRRPGEQTSTEVAHFIVQAAAERRRLVILSPVGRLIWRLDRFFPWLADRILDWGVNGGGRKRLQDRYR